MTSSVGVSDDTRTEHALAGGWVGGPSDCGAECACGVTFGGFDTHAEATAALDQHIADETRPLALAAPYELSAQEYVDALTATSHALHNEVVLMHYRAAAMSPRARREVLAGLDLYRQTLHSMVQRDLAAAVLTPDAVPPYVEGHALHGQFAGAVTSDVG